MDKKQKPYILLSLSDDDFVWDDWALVDERE
jgi:hypothetical protein